MADIRLTVDAEGLKGLFEKSDGMAKLLEHVLNEVLEAQVTEAPGAKRHERTGARRGHRTATARVPFTRASGGRTLRVPQMRDSEFSTGLFARYQRSEQVLVPAMMEMVINGASTGKVARITEELCGTSFSKSTVFALRAARPARRGLAEPTAGVFPFRTRRRTGDPHPLRVSRRLL